MITYNPLKRIGILYSVTYFTRYTLEADFMKFTRKQDMTRLLTNKGEKLFECAEYPAKFSTKSQLQRHSQVHIDEKPFKCTTVFEEI